MGLLLSLVTIMIESEAGCHLGCCGGAPGHEECARITDGACQNCHCNKNIHSCTVGIATKTCENWFGVCEDPSDCTTLLDQGACESKSSCKWTQFGCLLGTRQSVNASHYV